LGRPDSISGIEVHDLDPDASHRFPTADMLRKWEDFHAVRGDIRGTHA